MIEFSFNQIVADTISGIIKNLPFFVLIIWGVKRIVREMPHWISEYFLLRDNQLRLERALGKKT